MKIPEQIVSQVSSKEIQWCFGYRKAFWNSLNSKQPKILLVEYYYSIKHKKHFDFK